MNLKYYWSYFPKTYSYFLRKEKCLSYPEIFAIEVTNACIMSCKMCPRRYMTRPVGYMNFELFKKIIDQANCYSEWIWFHEMGDPLLHPELGKFIRYAKKKGIKTRLSTNPVMLNEKTIKTILNSGLDLLHLALDGINQEQYSFIRGKNANYEKALNRIKKLLMMKKKMRKVKPIVRVGIIKMKETEKIIPEFIKKWSKDGIDKIQVKEYKTFDGSVKDIIKFGGSNNFSGKFNRQKNIVCRNPWLNVVVLWNGKVTPCCNDFDGKYILGDLNHESLEAIWNNEKMRILRKQSLENSFPSSHPCANCREKSGASLSSFYTALQRKLGDFGVEAKRIVFKKNC